MKGRLLIAEDDAIIRTTLTQVLRLDGYEVLEAASGGEALATLQRERVEAMILDMRLPDTSGISVLLEAKKDWPEVSVVILTAYASVQEAVQAMKLGAEEYLIKPCSSEELKVVLEKVFAHKRVLDEYQYLKREMGLCEGLARLVGKTPAMQRMYELVEMVSGTDSNVLISGETGTGKDLVARAIHSMSPRKEKPFLKVDCGAIPQSLIESELFGHEAGAFSGAVRRHKGKFEQAHGGVVFLDEVSNIPLGVQATLLNVIQDREFHRVGGAEKISVDVRLLSATNLDLEEETKLNRFRKDLYYRLNVINIHVPPLRERLEDIPLLSRHFLERFNRFNERSVKGIDPGALDLLMRYDWPGNVREMENVIEQAVVLNDGDRITPGDLPRRLLRLEEQRALAPHGKAPRLKDARLQSEKEAVLAALESSGGNKNRAAKILGVSRMTLYNKLRSLGIDSKERGGPLSP